MREKFFKRARIPAAIVLVVGFILAGAANGILGELGTTIFQWLVQSVNQLITPGYWPWIILVLILLVILVIVVIISWNTKQTLDTTNRIVELDNWLQRLVPNLVSATNLDEEMERLMYQLLQFATAVFDESVHRASVFLPDPDRKRLRIRYSYQMPQETVNRTVFDIEPGKAGIMRGVAGEAFLDEEGFPQMVHVKHEKDKWTTDRESSYIFFDKSRPSVPYRSCVCVPISAGTGLANRLGVVCFDSESSSVFDAAMTQDSEVQTRLITVSTRFAAALQIYKELQTSHQP